MCRSHAKVRINNYSINNNNSNNNSNNICDELTVSRPFIVIARVDRMKEAKSEAEQIVAAYRAEMEAAYQAKLNMVTLFLLHLH